MARVFQESSKVQAIPKTEGRHKKVTRNRTFEVYK